MTLRKIEECCPTEDEEYMSKNQLEFFRRYLASWRLELVASAKSFVQTLKETAAPKPDPLDQSTANSEIALDFQTRSRQLKLIEEIDYALTRIADGEYGYCEVTGEEIGLKRLMARPVATMCIEMQEQHERMARGSARYAHRMSFEAGMA